jgi:predicted nucleic acid-binding protein
VGSLAVSPNSTIYLDANALIYSVEKKEPYAALLRPVWQASAQGVVRLVSSELLIVEILTGPLKQQNVPLVQAYEQLFAVGELELKQVSAPVLRRAAEIRASFGLKTPDAIHAATATLEGTATMVTNDAAFRRVPGLNVQLLSEVVSASP